MFSQLHPCTDTPLLLLRVMNAWLGPWGALPHLSNHINNPILHCAAWQPGPLHSVCLHWFFFFFWPLSLSLLVYRTQTHARTHTHHWIQAVVERVCVVWLICLISVLWILLIPLLPSLAFISPHSIPLHPTTSIICSLPPHHSHFPVLPPPCPSCPFISGSPPPSLTVLLPLSPLSLPLFSTISTIYSSYIFITSTLPPLSDIQQPIAVLHLLSGSVGGHKVDGMVLGERILNASSLLILSFSPIVLLFYHLC